MEAHWETLDGRKLYRAEVSQHHAFFARRDYHTPLEKKFRQMGGSVVLLANQAHRELHANVEPPHKPNPDLMRDIYLHARTREYEDSYDLFNQIAQYVGRVATSFQCDRNVQDANLLYPNLVTQAAYIEQGRLTLVRVAA